VLGSRLLLRDFTGVRDGVLCLGWILRKGNIPLCLLGEDSQRVYDDDHTRDNGGWSCWLFVREGLSGKGLL
jgi:hypothetical protein